MIRVSLQTDRQMTAATSPLRGPLRKRESHLSIAQIVKELRRQGFRVRNGGWPATLACEERWDFCHVRRMIFSLNPRAMKAMDKLFAEAAA